MRFFQGCQISVLLSGVFASLLGFADEPVSSCGRINEPIRGQYCIFTTPGSRNHDVIHFFHGSGSDERDWVSSAPSSFRPRAIRQTWKRVGFEAPVVIAVSFEPSWSLAELNTGVNPGYFGKYVDRVLPFVERQLGFTPRRRMLMGWSMGAGNVAQLLLKRPEMFERAALLCPAIVDIAPSHPGAYAHMTDVNQANSRQARSFVERMSQKFPDERSWLSFSPLDLGKSLLGPETPKLFISVSKDDEWGFFKPTLQFAELAMSKGVEVTWAPGHMGHCGENNEQTALFFIPVNEKGEKPLKHATDREIYVNLEGEESAKTVFYYGKISSSDGAWFEKTDGSLLCSRLQKNGHLVSEYEQCFVRMAGYDAKKTFIERFKRAAPIETEVYEYEMGGVRFKQLRTYFDAGPHISPKFSPHGFCRKTVNSNRSDEDPSLYSCYQQIR